MRGIAAIGVDDDLAAGEAAVAVGAADHEIAGRVDQEVGGLLRHPALRQRRLDRGRDHLLDQAGRVLLAVAALLVVLGRDHDLGAADRLAVDILHRDLALGVGLQVGELAVAALLRQHLQDLVREVDRRGHVRALLVHFALVAGVTEHHALVAGAFFFAALLFLGIDAHRDVGRLAVQQHLDVGAVVGEAVLVVADVLDHAARDLGDQFAIDHRDAVDGAEQLAAAFARDHDLVGRAQRLAAETGIDRAVVGNAELDVLLEEGIEDRVGDLVRNLVRMAFGNRLAGEQIGRAHQPTPCFRRIVGGSLS